MISSSQVALFGYGGSNAYFPAVWFAEADASHLLDHERGANGSDGAPSPGKSKSPWDEDPDLDQHLAKKLEYVSKIYAPTPPPSIAELPPSIEPPASTIVPEPAPAPVIVDLLPEQEAKPEPVRNDDEEALILILSQVV